MPIHKKFIFLYLLAFLLLIGSIFYYTKILSGNKINNSTTGSSESVFKDKSGETPNKLSHEEFESLSDYFYTKSMPYWDNCKFEPVAQMDDYIAIRALKDKIIMILNKYDIDTKSDDVLFWRTDAIANSEDESLYCNMIYVRDKNQKMILFEDINGNYIKEVINE